MNRRVHAIGAALASGVLAAGLLGIGSTSSARAEVAQLPTSPDNQMMVISLNLAETFNASDNAEIREIGNFARRLKAQLTAGNLSMPDVVLLQEVNAESAATAADLLSEYLYADPASSAFQVAVAPAAGQSSIYGNSSNPRLRRESAVLINTKTVQNGTALPEAEKYLAMPTAQADMINADAWAWNHAAIHRIVEKDGTGRLAAASVHMVKSNTFQQFARGTYKKGQWGQSLGDQMASMPQPTHLIAGDFNEDNVCEPEDVAAGLSSCPLSPLWNQLTVQRSYVPAVAPGKIDQVFVESGHLVAAGTDPDYRDDVVGTSTSADAFADCNQIWIDGDGWGAGERASTVSQGCVTQYYSDHAFNWALVSVAP